MKTAIKNLVNGENDMLQTYNIFTACDQNYLPGLRALIRSLARNAGGLIDLYLAADGLTEVDTQGLKELAPARVHVRPVAVPEALRAELEALNSRFMAGITWPSWLRLFAPELLPNDEQRCLYLDADTLCMGTLAGLYNTNLRGKALAGATHEAPKRTRPGQAAGVNAGVLVLDLARLRAGYSREKTLRLCAEQPPNGLADQAVLNRLHGGDILQIPACFYNLDAQTARQNPAVCSQKHVEELCTIVHFTHNPKPWEAGFAHWLGQFWRVFGEAEA
jgi:UDP-D-galactose:(glucosyl)LPS alpha-1,3-D-galactosyltransferase